MSDLYENLDFIPNKILMPDGSVTQMDGTVLSGPNEELARVYFHAPYIPAKVLNADGSVSEEFPTSGGGGGGSGVSSFNGRTGAVTPQNGDYTYNMVGADASGAAQTVQEDLNQTKIDIDNNITEAKNIAQTVQNELTAHEATKAINSGGAHGLQWTGSELQYQDNSGNWHPAAAGVSSFNGRVGAVVPADGDYTAAQVGALPASNIQFDTVAPVPGSPSAFPDGTLLFVYDEP